MSGSISPADEAVAAAVSNATAADVEQFKFLWEYHLKLQERGLVVYYIPKAMGQKIGNKGLEEAARRLW